MRKGFIRFIPLLVIAILLIGFVGYVSVKRLAALRPVVLSESDSRGGSDSSGGNDSNSGSGSKDSGSITSTVNVEVKKEAEVRDSSPEAKDDSLNENELDIESQSLEDVGNLKVDIPELSSEIEIENKVVKSNILNKVESVEPQASEAGKPHVIRVKGSKDLKFLGLVPVTMPITVDVNSVSGEQLAIIDQPFLLKYLDFLFTK